MKFKKVNKQKILNLSIELTNLQKYFLKQVAQTQMQTAFEDWQKKQHEEYFKKHPEAINNPLIKKMLDYKL